MLASWLLESDMSISLDFLTGGIKTPGIVEDPQERIQDELPSSGVDDLENVRQQILNVLDVAIPVLQAGETAATVQRRLQPIAPALIVGAAALIALFFLG